jgi:hypothetical protein
LENRHTLIKMKHKAKNILSLYVVAGISVLVYIVSPAFALQSTNYNFVETSLGGNGLLNSQSANFQASGSGAVLGIGNSAGVNFQLNAGNLTTNDPALSFAVNSSNINLGSFSAGVTAVATTSFQVINYTSYGYVVQALGTSPTKGSHTITAMSSTGPSQAGTEQFGINLVANTSPVSLGANPDHGLFGFGSASSNYGTANNYRFVSGETIASAPQSSGQTIYTISYIVNVNSLTPGGEYSGSQTILCTGTY